jgi:L-alanine-DL-glutamate epimerase-like enolase superfamily enzyme
MLFDNPPVPVKSAMTVPTEPGLGLTFTRAINEALDRGK